MLGAPGSGGFGAFFAEEAGVSIIACGGGVEIWVSLVWRVSEVCSARMEGVSVVEGVGERSGALGGATSSGIRGVVSGVSATCSGADVICAFMISEDSGWSGAVPRGGWISCSDGVIGSDSDDGGCTV